MDSPVESKSSRPCIHEDHGRRRRHYHFHVLPHCPMHSYIVHRNNHSPTCPLFHFHPPSQIPSLPDSQNLTHPQTEKSVPDSLMIQEENVELEEEEEEEEEEEDPVFVLTDEWRDFFAKSEAKRRLEKNQAKKKGKKK